MTRNAKSIIGLSAAVVVLGGGAVLSGGIGGGGVATVAAGGQREDHSQGQQHCKDFLHFHSPSSN